MVDHVPQQQDAAPGRRARVTCASAASGSKRSPYVVQYAVAIFCRLLKETYVVNVVPTRVIRNLNGYIIRDSNQTLRVDVEIHNNAVWSFVETQQTIKRRQR